MPIADSRDVFRNLVEDAKDTHWLLGLVAFARFEERRIEWMQHFEELNDRLPSSDEVEQWYLSQPDGTLLRAKGDAENALQAYAAEIAEEILDEHYQSIENEVIVSEIRSLKRPWADFGVSVAAGFISAFLFAAVLTILAIIVFTDASPNDIANWLDSDQNGVVEDGKESHEQGSN